MTGFLAGLICGFVAGCLIGGLAAGRALRRAARKRQQRASLRPAGPPTVPERAPGARDRAYPGAYDSPYDNAHDSPYDRGYDGTLDDRYGRGTLTANAAGTRPEAGPAGGQAAVQQQPAPPPDRNPFVTRLVGAAPALAARPASGQPAAIEAVPAHRVEGAEGAVLVVQPGNGNPARTRLPDARSSWRVGAKEETADIVIPEVSTDILIGRHGDVWTAASAGPVHPSVTLDAVTLPTVPMPWPADRKLRVGAITMTLTGISEPPATLADPANQVHGRLGGRYAAHAGQCALALARSGSERAESVAAAALACFDSRLLDPARGAALATLNMTLALRAQLREEDEEGEFDAERSRLGVAVAGFDRAGRLRAAANVPVAIWAVTGTGPAQLGESRAGLDSVEVVPVRVRDDLLRDMDRPLLVLATGPDVSVVAGRLRGLTTLSATPAQVAAAVSGPPGTDAPLAAAAGARALAPGSFAKPWEEQ